MYDEAELLLQRRRAERLAELGIEPVATLHHYTHPVWFQELGGWEDPRSVTAFRDFARVAGKALSPYVRTWVTLNEPVVFLLGGYMAGWIPPGIRSFASASKAFENLLLGHVEAVAAVRESIPEARFGIAHNMLDFAPDRLESFADRRLAAAAEALYNRALLDGIASDGVRWVFPGEGRAAFRVPNLSASNDFIGVNYYSRVHMRFRGLAGASGEFFYRDRDGRGLTQMGWEIHPGGLDRVVRLAAAATGLSVIVTENGIATGDDRIRRTFLHEHAVVLRHLRESGVPLEGYLHWSLIDNFEWLEGFRPKFGLFGVDPATGARRRRPSADLFASLGKSFAGTRVGPCAVRSS